MGEPVTILAKAASSNSVAPGTLGFLVVFAMAVLLIFLFRSMSKHIRKVNSAARRDQSADVPGTGNDTADAAPARSGSGSARDRRGDP
jgi:Na+-transporting methylmalonyl-CoA/oxaloacetate decarboxylase gamma subunit